MIDIKIGDIIYDGKIDPVNMGEVVCLFEHKDEVSMCAIKMKISGAFYMRKTDQLKKHNDVQ